MLRRHLEVRLIGVVLGLLVGADCGLAEKRGDEPPQVLATFPFDPNTRWILLPVTFEGRQYPFILDTGCTRTIFDISFKERLGKRFLWPKRGTAADGKSFVCEYFRAPEAFVGPLKINDGDLICAADVSIGTSSEPRIRVSGILGMDFLKNYVVQIDIDQATVSLLKSRKGVMCPRWGEGIRVKYRTFSGVPCVEGRVDGIPTTFLVDTGAAGVLSGRLKRDVFEKVRSGGGGVLRYEGQGRTMAQAAVPGMGSIALPTTLCLDDFVCRDAAFNDGHHSVLGLSFFSGHVVTFDFPNKRLYLKPARSRAPLGGGSFVLMRLGFTLGWRNGGPSVCEVVSGGIADREGLRQGDVLLDVDGQDVSGLTLIGLGRFLCSQGGKDKDNDALTLTFRHGDAVHRIIFEPAGPAANEPATN